MRRWREIHRQESRDYARIRYHSNINEMRKRSREKMAARVATIEGKLEKSVRDRIAKALKGMPKPFPAKTLLGCTIPELREHIEKQFLPGMTWDNYRNDIWHIDHVRPCSSFNFAIPDQQRVCFNFKNLRPLWAKENQCRKRPRCELAGEAVPV